MEATQGEDIGGSVDGARQVEDGNDAMMTVTINSEQERLIEGYRHDDGSADQEAPLRNPSSFDDQSLPPPSPLTTAHKSLTFFNCLSLVVSIQIGSGIFFTPTVVSNHVPTPTAGILVWVLAGILVWTGASCFIELGTTIPLNGGMQEYLRAGYGDFAGFLFSWTWLLIARPCSITISAMVFAEYINGIVLPALGLPEGWVANIGMALLMIWGITGVNCLGVKTGAKVAGWFLVLKLLIISSIIGAGIIVGIREKGGYLVKETAEVQQARIIKDADVKKSSVWEVLGEYVISVFAVLWVYGGWDTVGLVVGEMKDPARDLPRVLNFAMAIVITGFTLTVTSLYIVLPMSTIREKDTPIATFGSTLYGPIGFVIYTIAISLSAMGSINSNVFAIGRLAAAASRRDYIPRFLAGDSSLGMSVEEEGRWLQVTMQKWWPGWIVWCVTRFARLTWRLRVEEGVPIYGTLLNALFTSFYILTGTFRSLLTFIGIAQYIMFILTTLALFRLRLQPPTPLYSPLPGAKPAVATIYRTSIINPILFCVLSVILVGRGVVVEPGQGGAIAGLFGVTWLLWRWTERRGMAARRGRGRGSERMGMEVEI